MPIDSQSKSLVSSDKAISEYVVTIIELCKVEWTTKYDQVDAFGAKVVHESSKRCAFCSNWSDTNSVWRGRIYHSFCMI